MDDEVVAIARKKAYDVLRRYVDQRIQKGAPFDYTFDGFFNPQTSRIRLYVNGKRYTRFLKWD